jgi:class 3 adenylate cyclase/tetratricopeptide (TPR) repeat protein
MPFCSACGKRNADDARFCSACGTELERQESARELRKTVTIVFCDLAGSTSMGEKLDPEPLRRVMLRYYAEMRFALERHGGRVEKFIGDAVMAVFGVPVVHEDDALRAVRAAWEMKEALVTLNDELEARWGVRLVTRTGVNTGEVVAGDPSQGEGMVVGDCVNVAARLEQVAPRDEILIGEGTYRLVKHAVVSEPVEALTLKGKFEPVPAYRLASVEEGSAGVERRFDSPLVGRERELSQLEHVFLNARDESSCQLMSVIGPAGVGKSRLIFEFLATLRGRARVLRGRCLSYGEGITFWPLAEIVKDAAGIVDEDSPETARSKIADLVEGPDAESIAAAVAGAVGLGEGHQRDEMFWATRALLEALAAEQPLVVVLDDVHWGEETFLDLIEFLADHMQPVPVMLLCLARPELREVRQSLIGLEGRRDAIVLGELNAGDCERLVENLVGDRELASALASRLEQSVEGNPLFVEEMIRMMVDEGLLRRDDGRWRLEGDLEEFGMPSSIEALIASRLDRLEGGERGVVDRASIVGQEFWRGAVTELSPTVERGSVAASLDSLVEKELVRTGGQAFAGDVSYRFAHIMIRDVAYGTLLKDSRSVLHERFASWLETKVGERIGEYEEILGYHFEQAFIYRQELGTLSGQDLKLAVRALRYLPTAGRNAHARGDLPAAIKLLERALRLAAETNVGRQEVMFDLGLALFEVGQLERAQDILEDAAKAARAAGDRPFELRARLEAETLGLWTDPDNAIDVVTRTIEESIPVFEEAGDDLALARAWRHLGDIHGFHAHWGDLASACERALVHVRRCPDPRIEVRILAGLTGALFFGPAPAPIAIARIRELLTEIGKGPVYAAVVDAWALAGLEAMQGNVDEARSLCLNARAVFEEFGQVHRLADVALYLGRVEMLAANPAAAEAEFRRSYDTLMELGEHAPLSTVVGELAEALHAQGRAEEAERCADETARLSGAQDADPQVLWRVAKTKALAVRGDLEEAEERAREAVAIARGTDYPNLQANALQALAVVMRRCGRLEDSLAVAEEALALYESKGNRIQAARTREFARELEEADSESSAA